MEETFIEIRRAAPLGWVTINRPAARNALNAATWQALSEAVQSLAADQTIRVILLTGSGDKAFVAGQDIADQVIEHRGAAGQGGVDGRRERCLTGRGRDGNSARAEAAGIGG